jgi:hypothetical protein
MPHSALPPICGEEAALLALVREAPPIVRPRGGRPLEHIRSAFACALHMHQPTIPAGVDGALISHLQYMLEHPGEGDNHNAEPFAHCYRRMADLIPQLIADGCDPRIMLDYSGTLLWGFEQMGRHDILAALRFLACDPSMVPHVEWLGTFWGHAVAPSTPIPDLKLHIQAWQQHFAALFGSEALQRVRGFSLPEMALPNHPDTLHALVSALNDCGYRWLLLQEHSVENLDGSPLTQEQKHIPHQLVARSSSGATATITALIKTQGSDTKLVGQMQPCYEALGLSPVTLGGITIPPLVSQIADGENGGVMMNEFPQAFLQAHQRLAAGVASSGTTSCGTDPGGTDPCRTDPGNTDPGNTDPGNTDPGNTDPGKTLALNGTEYLDLLKAAGGSSEDFAPIQAVGQHRLWQALAGPPAREATPEATAAAIAELRARDPGFSMEGASWTNNLSWVSGYDNVLEPMQQLSARFHRVFDPLVERDPAVTRSPVYQEALLHLLLLQTSCFRYWGQGTWTDYARDIHRRGAALLERPAGATA